MKIWRKGKCENPISQKVDFSFSHYAYPALMCLVFLPNPFFCISLPRWWHTSAEHAALFGFICYILPNNCLNVEFTFVLTAALPMTITFISIVSDNVLLVYNWNISMYTCAALVPKSIDYSQQQVLLISPIRWFAASSIITEWLRCGRQQAELLQKKSALVSLVW